MMEIKEFLEKYGEQIKEEIARGLPYSVIAEHAGISRQYLTGKIVKMDPALEEAYNTRRKKAGAKTDNRHKAAMEASSGQYDFAAVEGERWKKISGYPDYYISNPGRVKKYIKRYKTCCLLKPQESKKSGRMYISLYKEKQRKAYSIARLVAAAFVEGYDKEHCTVNHEDGNVKNNREDNLSWQSQAENNRHAYRMLHRNTVRAGRYIFTKIVYREKYEFSTVASFARFIHKSETQTRRYLQNPKEHNITFLL